MLQQGSMHSAQLCMLTFFVFVWHKFLVLKLFNFIDLLTNIVLHFFWFNVFFFFF